VWNSSTRGAEVLCYSSQNQIQDSQVRNMNQRCVRWTWSLRCFQHWYLQRAFVCSDTEWSLPCVHRDDWHITLRKWWGHYMDTLSEGN
jgi:hypothetical protein